MKCYTAGSTNPHDWPIVEVCFAERSKQAKAFLWKNSGRLSDECDGDYLDVRVLRNKDHDKFLDQSKTEPYLVKDTKVLRQMGWAMEGEQACDCCGLHAMDIDEFSVCSMCGQCQECAPDTDSGCDDCDTEHDVGN